MAFIAHNVYKDGIDNTILKDDNKIFLALISADFESDENGGKIFDKDKVLALSELRSGSGLIADNDSSDLEQGQINDHINKVGNFNKKVLTILPIPYNRTASIIDNSGTANYFALIKYTGEGAAHQAYEVDTDTLDANGIPETKKIFFISPSSLDVADNFEVYLIGALSSNPTINANSNFMFGGASITFKEA